jgi:hypothetical protein
MQGRALVAKENDPHQVKRLSRFHWVYQQLRAWAMPAFANRLDIYLRWKAGCTWMPKGPQQAVMMSRQQAVRRDDSRIARWLSCKQVGDGVYRLAEGTLLHNFFRFLLAIGVMALLE